jgi:hypothetical protein
LANVKKIFSSETAWPNGAKLGRKHLCKILYKTSSKQNETDGRRTLSDGNTSHDPLGQVS